jgi:hypothetical protein
MVKNLFSQEQGFFAGQFHQCQFRTCTIAVITTSRAAQLRVLLPPSKISDGDPCIATEERRTSCRTVYVCSSADDPRSCAASVSPRVVDAGYTVTPYVMTGLAFELISLVAGINLRSNTLTVAMVSLAPVKI